MGSWQQHLSLFGRMFPVLGPRSDLRTDQFDGEDRPHELQWAFESHETRHLVCQHIAVVVEICR